MTNVDGESPQIYAVRFVASAREEVDAEHDRLQFLSGPAIADAWQEGMLAAVRGLATYPNRCVVAPEASLFTRGTVRQLLYRRTRSGPAWRILFTGHEADANDPATVRPFRHRGLRTMTEWPQDDEDA